jgi:hypothetical protein
MNRLATDGLTEPEVEKLVRGRSELFSTIISRQWLKEWKDWVKTGHYPRYIIDNYSDKTSRDAAIDGINVDHVFRSQFRTHSKQEPCDIEHISWGIEHIDRLRKANMEAKEQRLATWSGFTSVLLPVLTILGTFYITDQTLRNTRLLNENTTALTRQVAAADIRVKILDLLAKERGDSFAVSVNAMEDAFQAASKRDTQQLTSNLKAIRASFYKLEQEIESDEIRAELWKRYQEFSDLCQRLAALNRKTAASEDVLHRFQEQKRLTHDLLYKTIFVRTREEEDNLKLIYTSPTLAAKSTPIKAP